MCLEKYLVEQCAPTLASLKTGSLFGVIEDDAGELTRQVAEWQAQLAPKGLILTILRYRRGRALIYMGRLSQLKRDLACPGAEELLRSCGYEHENTEDILRQLRRRVCTCESFPHEIGLFLGYPVEDVVGFMENRGKNYLYSCYWKVYSDVERAKAWCSQWERVRDGLVKVVDSGVSISEMLRAGVVA